MLSTVKISLERPIYSSCKRSDSRVWANSLSLDSGLHKFLSRFTAPFLPRPLIQLRNTPSLRLVYLSPIGLIVKILKIGLRHHHSSAEKKGNKVKNKRMLVAGWPYHAQRPLWGRNWDCQRITQTHEIRINMCEIDSGPCGCSWWWLLVMHFLSCSALFPANCIITAF